MYWWQPGMGMGIVESLTVISSSIYRARLARRSRSGAMVAGRLVEDTDEDSVVVLRGFNESVMNMSADLIKLVQAHHFAGQVDTFRLCSYPMSLVAFLVIWDPADRIR
jgi:hypothetical protein